VCNCLLVFAVFHAVTMGTTHPVKGYAIFILRSFQKFVVSLLILLGMLIPPLRPLLRPTMREFFGPTSPGRSFDMETTFTFTFLYGLTFSRQIWEMVYADSFKEAYAGKKAPDCALYALNRSDRPHKQMKLLDLQQKGRPLVLVFGNCS
jgi:hypothetical protein